VCLEKKFSEKGTPTYILISSLIRHQAASQDRVVYHKFSHYRTLGIGLLHCSLTTAVNISRLCLRCVLCCSVA